MLTRLLVENFLLIREAGLEFSPGLNVLTGETGTGKSILLDALGLALGARASPGWVGTAGDSLQIEAVFQTDPAVRRWVRRMGIPAEKGELILKRQVRRGRPSRCFVNGHRVLHSVLRTLGSRLVEIHGQRQEERFRIPQVQRDLLDLFSDQTEQRRQVRGLFDDACRLRQQLADHHAQMARLGEEEDWIRFQLREIEEIDPAPEEDRELQQRVEALRAARGRTEWLALAEQVLNDREGAVLESLETLDERASRLPPGEEWEPIRDQLRAVLKGTRQLYRALRGLRDEASEEIRELPALEERLARIEHLQAKHRKPVPEILEAAGRMRESLARLEEGSAAAERLRRGVQGEEARLQGAASGLRSGRKKGAAQLARALQRELRVLGMKTCQLRVVLDPLDGSREGSIKLSDGWVVGPAGGERVHFEAETNPGSGFGPLGEIASGGEMARIALALRVVLGDRGRRSLTVFDEVDAGLGATAAVAVAKRLQRVARHRQVLLVTHLPVIAVRAQAHFRVWKEQRGSRSVAWAQPVEGSDRVTEVARMLSGDAGDPRALEHAEALLSSPPQANA